MDLEIEKPQTVDRWMMAMMIAIVVAYAWMAAAILEPKLEVPNGVVSSIVWVEGTEFKDWRDIRRTREFELTQIARELRKAEEDLVLLGKPAELPGLLIVVDEPRRYVISDTRIEISEAIALKRGQLRKAFIKSWLLQTQPKGSSAIATRSLTRLEVVSDVLTAMLSSDPRLGAFNDKGFIELPSPVSWARYAGSLDALCGSDWTSLDLQGRCGNSKRVHPLSFRPLLAGMIWKVFQEVPTFRRLELMRAWVAELNLEKPEGRGEEKALPRKLPEWRAWLNSEFKEIFPVEALALRMSLSDENQEALLKASRAVESMTLTADSRRFNVDFVFKSDRAVFDDKHDLLKEGVSYVVVNGASGARLFPGDIELDSDELRSISTPLLVWESCSGVSTGSLLNYSIVGERYLYVRSCKGEQRLKAWEQLARRGLAAFAGVRKEADFIQLHRENLLLAIRQGVVSRRTSVPSLMKASKERRSRLLGLNTSTWRRDIGAYRVLGAIEAVEWLRSSRMNNPQAEIF